MNGSKFLIGISWEILGFLLYGCRQSDEGGVAQKKRGEMT